MTTRRSQHSLAARRIPVSRSSTDELSLYLGCARCDPASQKNAPAESDETCGALPLAASTTRLPELLTFLELLDLLRVSRNTLYRLSNEGRIPGAYKIGKCWRYPRAALEGWLSGCAPGLVRPRQAKRWG